MIAVFNGNHVRRFTVAHGNQKWDSVSSRDLPPTRARVANESQSEEIEGAV